MPKPEWGTKRSCLSCGARFYDFGRSPIVCPSCGAVFDVEVLTRRRARPAARAAAVADEEVVADPNTETDAELEDTEAEVELEDDVPLEAEESADEDDALIEDASELGEDEDMTDVIEGEIDEEEAR
ncbi:MAG: TIGR02300 family protein [Geminicoccaceae bacterium]